MTVSKKQVIRNRKRAEDLLEMTESLTESLTKAKRRREMNPPRKDQHQPTPDAFLQQRYEALKHHLVAVRKHKLQNNLAFESIVPSTPLKTLKDIAESRPSDQKDIRGHAQIGADLAKYEMEWSASERKRVKGVKSPWKAHLKEVAFDYESVLAHQRLYQLVMAYPVLVHQNLLTASQLGAKKMADLIIQGGI